MWSLVDRVAITLSGRTGGMFTLLSVLPARELPPLATAVGPAPRSPDNSATPVLSYARGIGVTSLWLDRFLPANPSAARAVAVFLPVPIALAATFGSIYVLDEYGWGLFVGVPFAVGLMAAVLYGARTPRGVRGCVGVACLSLTVYGAALLLFAFEGAACLIMAAPLAYPIAMLGAVVGATLRGRPTGLEDAGRVVWVMMLFLPPFLGAEKLTTPDAPMYRVTTSIEINSPPSRVWVHAIGFGQMPPPTDWIFRTGIAYPIRARNSGHGRGATRLCVFSTGAFVEPISVWDEPHLLRFDVISNPPPMKEWSPYSNVHPPHLHNFLVSSRGQFELVELPGGRTRLEGTTWYRHHMWPAAYWRLWSDSIIHRIHLRVLNRIKALTEGAR